MCDAESLPANISSDFITAAVAQFCQSSCFVSMIIKRKLSVVI